MTSALAIAIVLVCGTVATLTASPDARAHVPRPFVGGESRGGAKLLSAERSASPALGGFVSDVVGTVTGETDTETTSRKNLETLNVDVYLDAAESNSLQLVVGDLRDMMNADLGPIKWSFLGNNNGGAHSLEQVVNVDYLPANYHASAYACAIGADGATHQSCPANAAFSCAPSAFGSMTSGVATSTAAAAASLGASSLGAEEREGDEDAFASVLAHVGFAPKEIEALTTTRRSSSSVGGRSRLKTTESTKKPETETAATGLSPDAVAAIHERLARMRTTSAAATAHEGVDPPAPATSSTAVDPAEIAKVREKLDGALDTVNAQPFSGKTGSYRVLARTLGIMAGDPRVVEGATPDVREMLAAAANATTTTEKVPDVNAPTKETNAAARAPTTETTKGLDANAVANIHEKLKREADEAKAREDAAPKPPTEVDAPPTEDKIAAIHAELERVRASRDAADDDLARHDDASRDAAVERSKPSKPKSPAEARVEALGPGEIKSTHDKLRDEAANALIHAVDDFTAEQRDERDAEARAPPGATAAAEAKRAAEHAEAVSKILNHLLDSVETYFTPAQVAEIRGRIEIATSLTAEKVAEIRAIIAAHAKNATTHDAGGRASEVQMRRIHDAFAGTDEPHDRGQTPTTPGAHHAWEKAASKVNLTSDQIAGIHGHIAEKEKEAEKKKAAEVEEAAPAEESTSETLSKMSAEDIAKMHEDVAKAVSSGKDAPVSSAAVKNIHELIANKTQSVAANKTQSVAAPAVASVVREPTDEELNDVHESVASEANVSEDLVKEIHEKIEAHVEAIGPGKKITPVELTPEEVKAVHDEHWEEGARKHNVSDETIEKMRQIIDWKEPITLTGLRTPDKRLEVRHPAGAPDCFAEMHGAEEAAGCSADVLPDWNSAQTVEILHEFGKRLEECYRIDANSSDVDVPCPSRFHDLADSLLASNIESSGAHFEEFKRGVHELFGPGGGTGGDDGPGPGGDDGPGPGGGGPSPGPEPSRKPIAERMAEKLKLSPEERKKQMLEKLQAVMTKVQSVVAAKTIAEVAPGAPAISAEEQAKIDENLARLQKQWEEAIALREAAEAARAKVEAEREAMKARVKARAEAEGKPPAAVKKEVAKEELLLDAALAGVPVKQVETQQTAASEDDACESTFAAMGTNSSLGICEATTSTRRRSLRLRRALLQDAVDAKWIVTILMSAVAVPETEIDAALGKLVASGAMLTAADTDAVNLITDPVSGAITGYTDANGAALTAEEAAEVLEDTSADVALAAAATSTAESSSGGAAGTESAWKPDPATPAAMYVQCVSAFLLKLEQSESAVANAAVNMTARVASVSGMCCDAVVQTKRATTASCTTLSSCLDTGLGYVKTQNNADALNAIRPTYKFQPWALIDDVAVCDAIECAKDVGEAIKYKICERRAPKNDELAGCAEYDFTSSPWYASLALVVLMIVGVLAVCCCALCCCCRARGWCCYGAREGKGGDVEKGKSNEATPLMMQQFQTFMAQAKAQQGGQASPGRKWNRQESTSTAPKKDADDASWDMSKMF
jgi:hypothetical protein